MKYRVNFNLFQMLLRLFFGCSWLLFLSLSSIFAQINPELRPLEPHMERRLFTGSRLHLMDSVEYFSRVFQNDLPDQVSPRIQNNPRFRDRSQSGSDFREQFFEETKELFGSSRNSFLWALDPLEALQSDFNLFLYEEKKTPRERPLSTQEAERLAENERALRYPSRSSHLYYQEEAERYQQRRTNLHEVFSTTMAETEERHSVEERFEIWRRLARDRIQELKKKNLQILFSRLGSEAQVVILPPGTAPEQPSTLSLKQKLEIDLKIGLAQMGSPFRPHTQLFSPTSVETISGLEKFAFVIDGQSHALDPIDITALWEWTANHRNHPNKYSQARESLPRFSMLEAADQILQDPETSAKNIHEKIKKKHTEIFPERSTSRLGKLSNSLSHWIAEFDLYDHKTSAPVENYFFWGQSQGGRFWEFQDHFSRIQQRPSLFRETIVKRLIKKLNPLSKFLGINLISWISLFGGAYVSEPLIEEAWNSPPAQELRREAQYRMHQASLSLQEQWEHFLSSIPDFERQNSRAVGIVDPDRDGKVLFKVSRGVAAGHFFITRPQQEVFAAPELVSVENVLNLTPTANEAGTLESYEISVTSQLPNSDNFYIPTPEGYRLKSLWVSDKEGKTIEGEALLQSHSLGLSSTHINLPGEPEIAQYKAVFEPVVPTTLDLPFLSTKDLEQIEDQLLQNGFTVLASELNEAAKKYNKVSLTTLAHILKSASTYRKPNGEFHKKFEIPSSYSLKDLNPSRLKPFEVGGIVCGQCDEGNYLYTALLNGLSNSRFQATPLEGFLYSGDQTLGTNDSHLASFVYEKDSDKGGTFVDATPVGATNSLVQVPLTADFIIYLRQKGWSESSIYQEIKSIFREKLRAESPQNIDPLFLQLLTPEDLPIVLKKSVYIPYAKNSAFYIHIPYAKNSAFYSRVMEDREAFLAQAKRVAQETNDRDILAEALRFLLFFGDSGFGEDLVRWFQKEPTSLYHHTPKSLEEVEKLKQVLSPQQVDQMFQWVEKDFSFERILFLAPLDPYRALRILGEAHRISNDEFLNSVDRMPRQLTMDSSSKESPLLKNLAEELFLKEIAAEVPDLGKIKLFFQVFLSLSKNTEDHFNELFSPLMRFFEREDINYILIQERQGASFVSFVKATFSNYNETLTLGDIEYIENLIDSLRVGASMEGRLLIELKYFSKEIARRRLDKKLLLGQISLSEALADQEEGLRPSLKALARYDQQNGIWKSSENKDRFYSDRYWDFRSALWEEDQLIEILLSSDVYHPRWSALRQLVNRKTIPQEKLLQWADQLLQKGGEADKSFAIWIRLFGHNQTALSEAQLKETIELWKSMDADPSVLSEPLSFYFDLDQFRSFVKGKPYIFMDLIIQKPNDPLLQKWIRDYPQEVNDLRLDYENRHGKSWSFRNSLAKAQVSQWRLSLKQRELQRNEIHKRETQALGAPLEEKAISLLDPAQNQEPPSLGLSPLFLPFLEKRELQIQSDKSPLAQSLEARLEDPEANQKTNEILQDLKAHLLKKMEAEKRQDKTQTYPDQSLAQGILAVIRFLSGSFSTPEFLEKLSLLGLRWNEDETLEDNLIKWTETIEKTTDYLVYTRRPKKLSENLALGIKETIRSFERALILKPAKACGEALKALSVR